MCRVFAWFSHFCMSLPYLCPILAKTIRLSKDNSKIINSSFFPACLRPWATARSENISYFLQIKSYLHFRVCFVRHLECFYTGAKKFYTISRIRLWSLLRKCCDQTPSPTTPITSFLRAGKWRSLTPARAGQRRIKRWRSSLSKRHSGHFGSTSELLNLNLVDQGI